jgi:hypothetical protein
MFTIGVHVILPIEAANKGRNDAITEYQGQILN